MARDFDGSSKVLFRTATPVITSYPCTMAAWVNADTFTGSPGVISFGSSSADDSRVGLYFHTTGQLYASVRNASTIRTWGTTAACSTGVWYNVIGTFYSSSSCTGYIDNVSTGSYVISSSPSWPTLGRTSVGAITRASTTQWLNGRVAEFAIWNVELSTDSRAALAAGYSPQLIQPQALVAYYPLHGRGGATAGEDDWVSNNALSDTGDPGLADHPRIIYPRWRSDIWVPAAASGLPTLSASTYVSGSLTSTGWRPRVTATY